MTNLYNFGAEMLRTHGNIHGALRELMIDFQLDGYKPDSTIPNNDAEQAGSEPAQAEQGAE